MRDRTRRDLNEIYKALNDNDRNYALFLIKRLISNLDAACSNTEQFLTWFEYVIIIMILRIQKLYSESR